MSRYVVVDKAAHIPNSCWGRYRKVAVVEVADDFPGILAMISLHARGVLSIVEVWDRVFWGKTDRCAYGRALAAATELADELNGNSQESILLSSSSTV